MTVSHAHARNACAHEQSTNIESGAVQWHKQSEQLLDCERECEREKVYCIVIASRTYCHPELVEGSRGNETSLYVCHFTSFRSREIATLTLAMTTGFCDKTRAERATPSRQSAELWHEHLSVYGLIAKIFCAVSNAISQVWLTLLRQTRNIVATTMTFA